jgi:hypothetical protein
MTPSRTDRLCDHEVRVLWRSLARMFAQQDDIDAVMTGEEAAACQRTLNEARDWFGYNPCQGGDEPLRPLNMAGAAAPAAES